MKIVSFVCCGVCCLGVAALAAPFKSPNGYRITPPLGFVLRPSTGFSGKFGSTSLDNQAVDALFTGPRGSSLMIISKPVTAKVTLPLLLQVLPSQMEGANAQNLKLGSTPLPGPGVKVHVLSKGYTTLGGTKAIFITSRVNQGAAVPVFSTRTVIGKRGDRLVILTCTALASEFSSRSIAFNRALSSVRWAK